MKRLIVVAVASAAVLSVAGWLVVGTARADTKAERYQTSGRRVRAALRQETFGENADRNTLLSMALEATPGFAPALWHSGHVRLHNEWVSFDDVPERIAQERKLTAYRIRREECPDTVEGHLALARWCAGKKLVDQQRAHLTRVVDLDQGNAEARRLLGFRLVDGEWISAEEMAESARDAVEAAKAVSQWRRKIEDIRDGLDRRGLAKQEGAKRRLSEIDDPAAIGTMELVLGRHNEAAAGLVVETVAKMPAPEASLALARQAVFSPWESVRLSAAEALSTRDKHSYVPALLGSMSTEIESQMTLYESPRGRATYRHVFFRKGQYKDALTVYQANYVSEGNGGLAGGQQWTVAQQAAGRSRDLETQKELQNAAIDQYNDRVSWVLCTATDENFRSPEEWWGWWNDHNEVYTEEPNPVTTQVQQDQMWVPSGAYGPAPSTFECLVAGTPVWTESGPMAVEQIKVGDRVLSQDPETGELDYKPVLRTTVRPPVELIRIRLGEEAIQASGGHPFWVSGKGWVKVRDLQPRDQLHGVTGTTAVDSVVETGSEETYNLVVADFHTYFVGAARVLSHDNTIRKPTDVLVPGLARQP